MEHVIIYFRHDTPDITPYFAACKRMRQLLAETQAGEYVEDDMALDGGDAETIFRGRSAESLFQAITPVLNNLPFLQGAQVTFVYGPLESGSRERKFTFEVGRFSDPDEPLAAWSLDVSADGHDLCFT